MSFWFAGHTVGFGNIAAQVPDPLAVGCRVTGYRDARFGASAQAMGIQRFEAGAFGNDHMQWATLHGGLAQADHLK
ncbi:hypothetical protein D3C72_2394580 [compost metagenome]